MPDPRSDALSGVARDRLAALALAAATLALFSPALGHGWLDYDDDQNFLRNPHYRGLGFAQLRWMLSGVIMGHWTPVTWLTHGLDYVLWGMNPAGYHLGNLLLHGANAGLVYLLGRRLLAAALPAVGAARVRAGALVAALLWALHPLRVESVAWITERRDVLAACLGLLAVLAWLRATSIEGRPGRGWYAASLALFVIGLLSKSMLVSLPLVLLVLDVYPLRRLHLGDGRTVRARLLEKAPFLALTCVIVAVTSLTMNATVRVTPLSLYGPDARVVMAAYSLAFYPWTTVAPLDLRPMYELPVTVSPLTLAFLGPTLIVAAVTVALVIARHRWPAGLAAWTTYALMLAPVSGLVHAGPQLVADRFSYLPIVPLCVLVGGVVTLGLGRPALARVVAVAAAAWITALAALTWSQVEVWRDTDTLFVYTLAVDPECAWCHAQYGGALGNRGDLTAAIPHLRRAVELRPHRPGYHANAGLALLRAGRAPESLPYLERAAAAQPGNLDAVTNLGLALVEVGRPADALPHLERARAARPGAVEPLAGLVRAARAVGRDADADTHLAALRRLDPAIAARVTP
jgi:Tfp pilus assembly protein PilF